MADSGFVIEIIKGLGAGLIGIAPVERFQEAPDGFRPDDIYPECKSVIVYAKRVPSAPVFIDNCVPYTHVNNLIMMEVDRLSLNISLKLEEMGIKNVLIPTDDPYEHWEPDRTYGRAILSLRHAGYLAGLGVLGKNTLLINREFGNMIQIGAVLADTELESTPIATYDGCPDDCNLCIDSCPQGALNGVTVNQLLCRAKSVYVSPKGYLLKKCNLCRSVCPLSLGTD
jgi:epoxyqueuosine reductase QueG